MERANGADTLARVADGLNTSSSQGSHIRRASLQPLPLQPRSPRPFPSKIEDTSQKHVASDDAVVVRSTAAQKLTLTPQRDRRLAAGVVPLSFESRIAHSDSAASRTAAVEFVADNSSSSSHASSAHDAFDPARLLIKVRPPASLLEKSWSHSTSFLTAQNASQYDTNEDHIINLRFRLRLCGSATTPTSPSFPH